MTEEQIESLDLDSAKAALRGVLKENEVESIARDRGFPNPHLIRTYAKSLADPSDIVDAIQADESKRNLWDAGYATSDVKQMSPERYREWRKEVGLA